MRFSDRIRLAWNIAFNSKARALLAPTWQDNQPVYNETSFENLVRHGWRKNELIFACVSKTAATASFVQLKVKDSRDKDLDDHPLRRLIARPNPFMDEYDFWYSVVVYQKLAGGAYFEKERDRAGRTVRLWPLRPDWLKPVRSQSLFISGYEYAVPGQSPVTMRAEDVIDFKLFDPLNLYRGYPPAAVAGRDTYLERIETLIDAMLADASVRLPGARRESAAVKARGEGASIPDALYTQIVELAS